MRGSLLLTSPCGRFLARLMLLMLTLAVGNHAHAQTTHPPTPSDDNRFQRFLQGIRLSQRNDSAEESQIPSDHPPDRTVVSASVVLEGTSLRPSNQTIRSDSYETTAAGAISPSDWWNQVGGRTCDCNAYGDSEQNCGGCGDHWHLFDEFWGMQIGGWAQGGVLGNPNGDINSPVLFNDRANEFLLNQFNVFLENAVCSDGSRWDFGGRVDLMYGTDSRFLAVPGLENHRDDTPKWNSETDRYGLAIPQAYFEIAAPVHQGLSLKVGHFYSIAGYESVPAPYNFFYSHSYALVFGQPFTHTGALTTYRPTHQVTMQLGYTQGWDALSSLANTDGILGRLVFTSRDRRSSLAATVHTGRDVTGVTAGVPLDEDRHFVNLVFRHQVTDRLRCVLQSDFGYQEDAKVIVSPGPSTIAFDSATWGGMTSYLFYDIDPEWTSALRFEWFKDADQSRLGIPVAFNPGGPTFNGGNYYALTAGLNCTPNSNIIFRPELRWDWSDLKGNGAVPGGDSSIRAFDNRTSSSQVTVGADLIVLF